MTDKTKGRAIGQIGAGDMVKLEKAGLVVVDKDAYVALRNKAAFASDFQALADKQRKQLDEARKTLDSLNALYSKAVERAEWADAALRKILHNEEYVGAPYSASAEIARDALGQAAPTPAVSLPPLLKRYNDE